MARHDQKGQAHKFVCPKCREDKCVECFDIVRIFANLPAICFCTRRNHSGEPRDNQVADPFTGDVHAPGLTVTYEGEVIKNADRGASS